MHARRKPREQQRQGRWRRLRFYLILVDSGLEDTL